MYFIRSNAYKSSSLPFPHFLRRLYPSSFPQSQAILPTLRIYHTSKNTFPSHREHWLANHMNSNRYRFISSDSHILRTYATRCNTLHVASLVQVYRLVLTKPDFTGKQIWKGLTDSVCGSSEALSNLEIFDTQHSPSSPAVVLFAAFFGLFGGESEDDDPTKIPPSVKRHLLKAQRHRRKGNFRGAVRSCHKALEIISTSKYAATQVYVEGRAYVLDMLANVYLEQGQLNKAEVNFKETMKIMISAGIEQDSEAIIEISLKLSKIYSNQRKHEIAVVGFKWCVDKAREKWSESQSPESHAFLGMCLHGMGQYYLVVQRFGEAAAAFREAVGIARQVYGDEDLQVAVMLNDLGTALDGQGQFDEAEEAVMEGLEVARLNKNLPEIDEYLAIIQCNLAEINSHQGKKKSVSESCGRALAAAKRTGDKTFCEIIRKRCLSLND